VGVDSEIRSGKFVLLSDSGDIIAAQNLLNMGDHQPMKEHRRINRRGPNRETMFPRAHDVRWRGLNHSAKFEVGTRLLPLDILVPLFHPSLCAPQDINIGDDDLNHHDSMPQLSDSLAVNVSWICYLRCKQ